MKNNSINLEKKLNLKFADKKILVKSLTHKSYDSKKKRAVIAVELTDDNKVKRVYIKSIDDYSAKSLTPIFE